MNTQHIPTGQYARVNGLKMYYEIHGSGTPLVLLHGGGSTILSTFGRILPELAKTHRVIAIELQAHGHTPDIDRPLSFEQDASDGHDRGFPQRGRERREMIFATELIGKHLKIDLKPPQGDFLRSPPDSKITPPTCGRVARPQNEQSQYTTICTVL
jgi:hypothetical protein